MEYSFAITPRFHETKIDKLISVEEKYYKFFSQYKTMINLIPYSISFLDKYFEINKPQAIIFAGGYRLYTNEIRDFEYNVMRIALNKKIPILAICCGMWTVNGYYNGTLKFNEKHQGLEGDNINLKRIIHFVEAESFIDNGIYKVNSFHSKVIDKLGDNLEVFLKSEDGEIEGVYNLDNKILGVQFHMENKGVEQHLTNQIMKKFYSFID